MEAKVQELVNKIYQDGIDQARSAGEQILESARSEAAEIIARARSEAQQVLKEAAAESTELKERVEAELTLAGVRLVADLRRRLKNIFTNRLLEAPVSELSQEPEFIKEMLLALTSNWRSEDGAQSVELLLPPERKEQFAKKVGAALQEQLKQLTIKSDPSLPTGFRVVRKEDNYLLDFSDEALIEFLRPFLNQKTEELLGELNQE